MRKLTVGLMVGVAALVAGSSAIAGLRVIESVSVNTATRFASGSLASARAAADSVQFIGCGATWRTDGTVNGSCFAKTAAGVSGSCTFSDTNLAHALGAVSGDTRLQFRWDATNKCTSISLEDASYWAPKQP